MSREVSVVEGGPAFGVTRRLYRATLTQIVHQPSPQSIAPAGINVGNSSMYGAELEQPLSCNRSTENFSIRRSYAKRCMSLITSRIALRHGLVDGGTCRTLHALGKSQVLDLTVRRSHGLAPGTTSQLSAAYLSLSEYSRHYNARLE